MALWKFMFGMGILAEVINTQALYAVLEIEVIPQYDVIHAPIERPNVKSSIIAHFAVRVGVDEEQWSAYQKELQRSSPGFISVVEALRDCLRRAGVPTIYDLGEIATQIRRFHVKWRLQALNRVARINEKASNFSSLHSHSLTMVNPTQALAKDSPGGLAVDILPVRETQAEHQQGCLVPDPVTARAELSLNVVPQARTFKRVMGGNLKTLPNSVVELAFGMFRALKFIPASGTTIVRHHEGTTGTSGIGLQQWWRAGNRDACRANPRRELHLRRIRSGHHGCSVMEPDGALTL